MKLQVEVMESAELSNQGISGAVDDGVNHVQHTLEYFKNRVSFSNPRLCEHYIDGQLHILIHFRSSRRSEEFVAVFQRQNDAHRTDKFGARQASGKAGTKNAMEFPPITFLDTASSVRGSCGDQQTVLVDDIETVKLPEGSIPSLVWAGLVDEVYGILPHALYFSRLSGVVSRGVIEDGIGGLRRWCSIIGKDELVGKMIQRRSAILEHIPDQKIDANVSAGRQPFSASFPPASW